MLKKFYLIALLSSFLTLASAFGAGRPQFESKMDDQYQRSVGWLKLNLSPAQSLPGSIVAAPSHDRPNYYFHWVRDAALVTSGLLDFYSLAPAKHRMDLKSFFLDHIRFNFLMNQKIVGVSNLGEPKFYMDASPYTGPWGRPQNDGPALRAISMIDLLSVMEKEAWPEREALRKELYDGAWPSRSLIKGDLEYTAHNWDYFCFDLWEEVNGFHFYTLMAQRKSLIQGARLARASGDFGAADFYEHQAHSIDSQLGYFWNPSQGHIMATLFPQFIFASGKESPIRFRSHLDSATILAVLHSELPDSSFSVHDDRVLATYHRLRDSFSNEYAINHKSARNRGLTENLPLGVAFGRYPEDTYNGYDTNGLGNPWVLTTAGAAEFLYRLVAHLHREGKVTISSNNISFYRDVSKVNNLKLGSYRHGGNAQFQAILKGLFDEADSLMARVLYHRNPDGSLSEQINRQTGYMQGAPNLTWSHASFITAKISRDQVRAFFK